MHFYLFGFLSPLSQVIDFVRVLKPSKPNGNIVQGSADFIYARKINKSRDFTGSKKGKRGVRIIAASLLVFLVGLTVLCIWQLQRACTRTRTEIRVCER